MSCVAKKLNKTTLPNPLKVTEDAKTFTASNETEISCGGRESEWPAGEVFESSQKLIARLPAVGFIDWLGLLGLIFNRNAPPPPLLLHIQAAGRAAPVASERGIDFSAAGKDFDTDNPRPGHEGFHPRARSRKYRFPIRGRNELVMSKERRTDVSDPVSRACCATNKRG